MLNLAANGYTMQPIDDMLHSKHGIRNVRFRYALLNYYDVEIGELSVEPGANITLDSLAEITRRGKFSLKENELQDVDWLNDRIKPYFRLMMPGGYAEWPLGVFLISSPTRQDNPGRILREVETYDTSLVLKEDKFTTRYRIATTTKYTDAIQDIVEGAGLWKINITASTATLSVDKEFDIGTPKLQAINTLLAEINYTALWIDENGYAVASPYIIPTDRETEYTYKTNQLSIIHPGAIQEKDLFSVPNKWVVTASNPEKAVLTSTYINDLPTSPTSTINRKRTIVDFRTIDDVFDQTTLDDYTKRIAYSASQIYDRFIFDTALMPHHSYSNMLFVDHSKLDVAAKYSETRWSMDLTAGGRMKHECRRVIKI
jgi:hypothetical protein